MSSLRDSRLRNIPYAIICRPYGTRHLRNIPYVIFFRSYGTRHLRYFYQTPIIKNHGDQHLHFKIPQKISNKTRKTFAARFFLLNLQLNQPHATNLPQKNNKLYRRKPYHPTPIPKNTPTPILHPTGHDDRRHRLLTLYAHPQGQGAATPVMLGNTLDNI